MRGVIEEKTNRIIEVILSSVKPFQLMMGKIIGVGMVGLTQFLLWIVITIALSMTVGTAVIKSNMASRTETVSQVAKSGEAKEAIAAGAQNDSGDIMKNIGDIP